MVGQLQVVERQVSAAVRMRQPASIGTLLLLEADPDLRRAIAASLQQDGWKVLQAESTEAARRLMERESLAALVVELDPPQHDPGRLIELFRRRRGRPPGGVVVLTTIQRPGDDWRKKYHPDSVVYKPLDVRYLGRRIRELVMAQHGGSLAVQQS